MAFLRKTTPNGHNMADVYSGLQKSLRRGLITETIYFAKEIGSEYPNALKKRLLQNLLEDTSNIELALKIMNDKNLELNNLLKWSIIICNIPKSHISAWVNRVAIGKLIDNNFVSYKSIKNLMEEKKELECIIRGSWLRATNKDEEIFNELELDKNTHKQLWKLFKFINESPLVWISYILFNLRLELHTLNMEQNNIIIPDNIPEKIDPLPDWIYDKHTKRGKQLKRGYEHFFVSSLIMKTKIYENEEPYEIEAKQYYLADETKSAKVLDKLNIENVIIESEVTQGKNQITKSKTTSNIVFEIIDTSIEEEFTDFLQAQCITGAHKPRVYFARNIETNKIQVIKGPNEKYINEYILTENIKKILNLPHTNMYLKTNLSGNKIPTGSYLISDCVGMNDNYDINKYILRTTSLETDVKISTNTINHWSHEYLTQNLELEILLVLAFRKCIGTVDTCNRNLIIDNINNKIISIDDPALFVEKPYMWSKALSEKYKGLYESLVSKLWTELTNILNSWKIKINQSNLDTDKKQYFINKINELVSSPSLWKW